MSFSDIDPHVPGLCFSGGRFDARHLSAKAFAAAGQEFLAFQNAIIAIASHLYRKENPNASQLPHHFVDSLELGIEHVSRGSVRLSVRPIDPVPDAQRLVEVPHTYYENSVEVHQRILVEISEQGYSESLYKLPRAVGETLTRMGRQLEDGERIIVTGTSGIEYDFDRHVRKVLGDSLKVDQRACDLIVGRIIRVEADLSRVTMVLCAEPRPTNIEIPYAEQVSLDAIKSALTSLKDEGPIVAARGTFSYVDSSFETGQSVIEELSAVNEAVSQRAQDFIEELESISSLSDGWYDKDSLAPQEAATLGARALVAPLLFYGLPFPHAFPLVDGGVSLEWSLGSVEASITFHASSETATVASWDSGTDEHRYDEQTPITVDALRKWFDSFEGQGRV